MRNISIPTWYALPHILGAPQPGQLTQIPSVTLTKDFEPPSTKLEI